MSKLVLEVEIDESTTLQVSRMDSAIKDNVMNKLMNLMNGIQGGVYNAVLNEKLGAVQASITGTFTDNPLNTETIVINGVTFTAVTSGATGDQWNIVQGGSAAADAAGNASGLAAAINASTTAGVLDVVFASSALGVVTFTSKQAGKAGNAIILSEALTAFTLAATRLAGGTQSTNRTFQFSKVPTTTY